MKISRVLLLVFACLLAAVFLTTARAVTFTTNSLITFTNTSFDGQDIELTNCTVTVDGPHSFTSVRILNGGILTHSFGANGMLSLQLSIFAESHTLSDTNPATLNLTNAVWTTVVVRDAGGTTNYLPGVDYELIASGIFTSIGRLTNSAIPEGGTITVSYDFLAQVYAGVRLSVSNSFEIEPGGAINANGLGFSTGFGPGTGRSAVTNYPYPFIGGSGGGYGGYGGASASRAAGGAGYGEVATPGDIGSGGGAGTGTGGRGGGAVDLNVGGLLRVDGPISANGENGTNANSGGGAGGGIWLAAQTFAGTAPISANGGAGEPNNGGGGGGGRIAISFDTNSFSGNLAAFGGAGATYGGAGTILTWSGQSVSGQALADNGGHRGANTLLSISGAVDVIVAGGAIVNPAIVDFGVSYSSLLVRSNSWISLSTPVSIMVRTNATLEVGGGLEADAKGYVGGTGPGAGRTFTGYAGGGGGHGGYGGAGLTNALGGSSYGSVTELTSLDRGSGGGAGAGTAPNNLGGAGGGSVQLTVLGTLLLDGVITADGGAGIGQGSGGGAGGGIGVSARTFAGAGLVKANGGSAALPAGGGGGGGRIAVFYVTNQFTGLLEAKGGPGAQAGGAGTIYTRTNNNQFGQLVIDNRGVNGTNTPLPATGQFDLTVRGGAIASGASFQGTGIGKLSIGSNSWIGYFGRAANLSVSGDAVIEAGGGFLLDGQGFGGGLGGGAGRTLFTNPYGNSGGGAGYGGYGGGSGLGAAGGLSYGSLPFLTGGVELGSGGGAGNGSSTNNLGGAGGGALGLTVVGSLRLDGVITANGRAGVGQWSGGGSGGSIMLSVGRFVGQGALFANGGAGDAPYGGGGGGGRIQIQVTFATNQFAGTISAAGGSGANYGGAGTIYLRTNSTPFPLIIMDNGGNRGTNTLLSYSGGQFDLTIRGGAVVYVTLTSLPPLGSLLIASNSWLSYTSPFAPRTLIVNNNATIQAGGGISLDGQSSTQGVGFGSTSSATGGGGGYGGFGGRSSTNAAGGNPYGSLTAPIDLGSGGGNGGGTGGLISGGLGGGALHLTVNGALSLDGRISADGNAGTGQNSGGGSGGSLWLTVGRITGTGLISANGGPGDLPGGGGGGGGRIALTITTNLFVTNFFAGGTISARGGIGANYGGAGTIYLKQNSKLQAQVLVDNAGNRGAATGLPGVSDFDLSVIGGAQLLITNITTIGTLLVGTNSSLSYTSPYSPRTLTILSNATIQTGGAITLDGEGFGRALGTGAGATVGNTGGGGGYGGYGGRSATNALGGNAYGSALSPVDMGSGGGGQFTDQFGATGSGGGALKLTVGGTLLVDGRIGADGVSGLSWGGGGSGGSLWLTAGRLAGAGLISANGGAGDLPMGGGGGGGRIALNYGTNQFTGSVNARGGAGAGFGGAGTIYWKGNGNSSGLLIADNGGAGGTNTLLSFTGVTGVVDLTLTNGAKVVFAPGQVSLANLMVGSNSWLLFAYPGYLTSLTLNNATIRAGGGISLDGQGFPGGQGPGAGRSVSSLAYGVTGGGGGNGGYGGSSISAAGGNASGSEAQPRDYGSGGGTGNGNSTNNLGGAGGGALHLTVAGSLALDGRISADGSPGNGQWSGGGSGGDLWLTVGSLTGSTGAISANGGSGDLPYGGGGGGGRISITYSTNLFQGSLSAIGGAGATYGGAGTIYRKANNTENAVIIADNGGASGTNTALFQTFNFDLFVRGGAKVSPMANLTLNNLTVSSNSWLAQLRDTLSSSLNLVVRGVATLEAGGGITASGAAASGGQGPGGTLFVSAYGYTGGGGGHGGYGGASFDGAPGGNSYGSLLQPTAPGSSGGGITMTFPAPGSPARGGGVIRLVAFNPMVLDGQISAEGGDAGPEGYGGGSGGSIWINAGQILGHGTISADGGSGDFLFGGGGGGGRIALYGGTNAFAGGVHAWGGYGAMLGGAGTVYARLSNQAVGRMVVDNGGLNGTNTPLSTPEAFDLRVLGGAVVNPSASVPSGSQPLTINSLLVDSGGSLTHLAGQANLDTIVLGNATVETNSTVAVNGVGFGGFDGGPGVGQMLPGGSGSGGGYGGSGGASGSGAPGGTTYGSALQPVDRGSRGGMDSSAATNRTFSAGGGAVRLRVGGTLLVNGRITANGADGLVDRAGGGSGGSVWITARTLAGQGFIAANGGSGEPEDGGGGGGGRVAVNCRTNAFPGPIVAYGGLGASFGGNGTVVITNIPAPQVIGQTPAGVVSYAVEAVDLTFDSPMNGATFSTADVLMDTPNGVLDQASLTSSALGLSVVRIGMPAQTTSGYYEVQAGPAVEDIYGQPMLGTYIGSFVILPPVISGRVTDAHGLPVQFVTVKPSGGLAPDVTDANGFYSVEVTPGWAGTLTPVKGSAIFLPASRSYPSVTGDMGDQNFVATTSAVMTMSVHRQGGDLSMDWYGIGGVSYQPLYSSNLVDWVPYQGPLLGTNGPMKLVVPVDATPANFFRFGASY